METIIVIVVVSVGLLTIFSSYNKILSKLRTENKYDTSEYIYMTKYIKEYLDPTTTPQNIEKAGDILNYAGNESESMSKLKLLYGIEKIYLLTNLNNFGGNENKVDAYMIDYIKKLDVRDQDKLLIVEYKRVVKDSDNNEVRDTQGNTLYETYISSLEWD